MTFVHSTLPGEFKFNWVAFVILFLIPSITTATLETPFSRQRARDLIHLENVIFLDDFESRETINEWRVYEGDISEEVHPHQVHQSSPDHSLVVNSRGNVAVGRPLHTTFDFEINDTLVVQYEVRHQNKLTCSGAYLKFLPTMPSRLTPNTSYSLLFGPDFCGDAKNRVLLIVYARDSQNRLHKFRLYPRTVVGIDELTHIYTLVFDKSFRYQIRIDGDVMLEGDAQDFVEEISGEDNPFPLELLNQLSLLTFSALSIEIFTRDGNIAFDSILVSTDVRPALSLISEHWNPLIDWEDRIRVSRNAAIVNPKALDAFNRLLNDPTLATILSPSTLALLKQQDERILLIFGASAFFMMILAMGYFVYRFLDVPAAIPKATPPPSTNPISSSPPRSSVKEKHE